MAARRKSARSSQPEEDAYSSSRPSPVEGAPLPSRFTALVLTVPGIVIYTYILYTMISKLVYPGSFSPFSNAPRPPFYEGNATGGMCLSRSTTPCQRCGLCESCILKNLSLCLSFPSPSDPVLARAILLNSGLIFLFFIQHSLMARLPVRTLFDRMNIPAINRPFYVTCTCIAINVSWNMRLLCF